MTDRRGKDDYWAVRLDAEIRAWVRELRARKPGTWRSERALLLEVIHRGQMTFEGPSGPANVNLKSQGPTLNAAPIGADVGEISPVSDPRSTSHLNDAGPRTSEIPPRIPARTESRAAEPAVTWSAPIVQCPRCGEDVETTAAAREAHFAVCPPSPSGLEDELVRELRRRLSTTAGPATDPGLEKDLQVVLAQQLAAERGLDVDMEKAGDLLRRALGTDG